MAKGFLDSLRGHAMAAPFRQLVFRRIWLASLCSNLGLMIQGVGAAWAMTELTSSASMVALVQTALMLPVMIVALGAGALADMYDRRIVGLAALSIAFCGAVALTTLSLMGMITPPVLLTFCFTIGAGMALFAPAWQASVSEQVPAEVLPAAVALNSISYNIARSFGPAIGGTIVAVLGVTAAFLCNAVLYLPLLIALYVWRRVREPSRLPPERFGRAMALGVRYLVFSPSIRAVLGRAFITAIFGGSVSALMPLVARDLLGGGAQTYGVMLGAFGMGAVAGALNIDVIRRKMSSETAVRMAPLAMGLAVVGVSLSRMPVLTAACLFIAGGGWMVSLTLFNIGVQLSTPRWVAGRALAAYQASVSGGIAIGSWWWGRVAQAHGVDTALLAAGACMLALPLVGRWLKMPSAAQSNAAATNVLADPDVNLAITERSGPIVVEIQYLIDPAEARDFHGLMQTLQLIRQRNGAYGWSIVRDIAHPDRWTERFHFPTWLDYLRHRNRPTQAERDIQARATAFHKGAEPPHVTRMLERPFGSVRWKETSPDRQGQAVLPMQSHPGGA